MRALVITRVRTRMPAIQVKSRLVITRGTTVWTYAMSTVESRLFCALRGESDSKKRRWNEGRRRRRRDRAIMARTRRRRGMWRWECINLQLHRCTHHPLRSEEPESELSQTRVRWVKAITQSIQYKVHYTRTVAEPPSYPLSLEHVLRTFPQIPYPPTEASSGPFYQEYQISQSSEVSPSLPSINWLSTLPSVLEGPLVPPTSPSELHSLKPNPYLL